MAKNFGILSQGTYAGTDQGVDFTGAGAIPALDSGVVTDRGFGTIIEGGRVPYIIYRLTSGPYKGHYVYVAESFIPTVKVGTRLKRGSKIGQATGGGYGIEIGFNKTGKGWNPVAPLYPNPHGAKPAGNAMWSYMQGVIGLAPKVQSGGGGYGLSDFGQNALGVATFGLAGRLPFQQKGLGDIHPFAWVDKLIYAFAIGGGGLVAILGFVLVAADIGLSSRANRAVNEIPLTAAVRRNTRNRAAKAKASTSAESMAARERRSEEAHASKLKSEKTRRKLQRAQTSHTKNKIRTGKEQRRKEAASYGQGRIDQASPTMARIRKERQAS